ncbi:acetyl-CoA acetyltransferase [Vibrio navarrensis]|uniref:Thiolase family protein n=1 Tax=Vibrio navarrensis TaxID=29495 RepID=A0AAJ4IF04_9VIBR|nr:MULTISPECIES: thiolase family protein [Vibrio]KJR35595.1 acetyl-CoA acetyltransferase [Vibrio sp. S234-5]MBE3652412.1 acetyl-CoA acetyltransferase [Vibrio navarrensis]MBE3661875.1 acetyl-CoA acetyltransferase [Vibrio navarrensis]MBE4604348.1 acetyl-CoA acetyltransferase [Vibrio navarrensis]QPL55680.1 thiolase family protein [Vibrio navarrensis]
MEKAIWIVSAKRTPQGRFQGALKEYSAPQLGGFAIKAALSATSKAIENVDEVLMGCVLPAGCGQAPARQAALNAGLPLSVGATTLNKVCGSGMKAVMLAHDLIKAGSARSVIAGGMESMTNAPYLLSNARSGMRMGHQTTFDHMFYDGLQDAYEGHLMGVYAQQIADKLQFTRQQMDEWAALSAKRAWEAQEQQLFVAEMAPLAFGKNGELLDYDEHPRSITLEKIPLLKPAFAEDGSVTAANASAIADGAAALLLMDEGSARSQGLEPLAILRGHSTHARKPAEFTLAPVYAIEQLLSKLDWSSDEVDLWEINEAFAVVTQIAVKQLGLEMEKVNVKGGACALGHPIGASGARILVTLIHSLRQLQALGVDGDRTQPKVMRGVASLCIGGGEATAIGIEIPLP